MSFLPLLFYLCFTIWKSALRWNLLILFLKVINHNNNLWRHQVVKADDVIMDSEYLQTLIVAVPVALEKEWKNSYENLTEFVAPKSSRYCFYINYLISLDVLWQFINILKKKIKVLSYLSLNYILIINFFVCWKKK